MEEYIQNSKPKRKGLLVVIVLVFLAVIAASFFYFIPKIQEDEVPPRLQSSQSNLQGFLKRDVTIEFKNISHKFKFLGFDQEDKDFFEQNKAGYISSNLPVLTLKPTAENEGLFSTYSDTDETLESILRKIDPKAGAVAIAFYDETRQKFIITENDFYSNAETVPVDKLDQYKIQKGHLIFIITFRETEVYGLKDGTKFAKNAASICTKKNGWYNFAITEAQAKDLRSLFEPCLQNIKQIYVQTGAKPTKFERVYRNTSKGTDNPQKISDSNPKFSLLWVEVGEGFKTVGGQDSEVEPQEDTEPTPDASAIPEGETSAPVALPPPQNFTIDKYYEEGDYLRLTWNTPAGDLLITKYEAKATATDGTKKDFIFDLSNYDQFSSKIEEWQPTGDSETTYMNFYGLDKGKTYIITLTAFNSTGNESEPATTQEYTVPPSIQPPPPPSNIMGTAQIQKTSEGNYCYTGVFKLAWRKNSSSAIDSYQIYYRLEDTSNITFHNGTDKVSITIDTSGSSKLDLQDKEYTVAKIGEDANDYFISAYIYHLNWLNNYKSKIKEFVITAHNEAGYSDEATYNISNIMGISNDINCYQEFSSKDLEDF